MNWQDVDPAIQRKAKDVLIRMQLLSEGPASALGRTSISHGKSETKAPTATKTLFEEWLPRFARATDERTIRDLIDAGEVAILRYRGKYVTEMELPTDDTAAMEKVVEVYEGLTPEAVVVRLASSVSVGWVKTARRKHRRDPDTGKRHEGWRGWDDERRRTEIDKALNRGQSLRQTAEQFACPLTSFHRDYGRFWQQGPRAAA